MNTQACKIDLIAYRLLISASGDLLAACAEALEFAEDQSDVMDGPDGKPQANRAMRLAETLRAAIAKATGSAT